MKKKLFVFFSTLTLSILNTACSWQIPEKVSVKTNAEYNFSIGTVEQDFSDKFDRKKLFNTDTLKDAKIYDYFPEGSDDKTQQFMMRIPLMEIPIDFSKYFDNSDLSTAIEGLSFSKQVEIPSISFSKTESVDTSFVSTAINAAITFTGSTTGGSVIFSAAEEIKFEEVSYDSGSINVKAPLKNGVVVVISDGAISSRASFLGGNAVVDIANLAIRKDNIQVTFDPPAVGTFIATISNDSKLKKATGITYDIPKAYPISSEIDLGKDSQFESCEIGDGSIKTKLTLPEDWSGISITYTMESSGGIEIPEEDVSKNNGVINLSGKTFEPKKTTFTTKLKLKLQNATYTSNTVKLDISSEIKKFNKIALNLSEMSDLNISKNDNLPSGLTSSVKSIKLNKSGLKATYKNTFPEGNDITIKANSAFFGINGKSSTLSSGMKATDKEKTFELMSDDVRTVNISSSITDTESNKFSKWDFNTQVFLPGVTEESTNKKLLTISNVEPGQKYEISMNITPEINWEEIVINMSSLPALNDANNPFKGENNLNFGLNSIFSNFDSSFGSDLSKNIQLSSIPIYIYFNKPEIKGDPFGSFGLKGSASFCAKKDDGTVLKEKEILKSDQIINPQNEPQLTTKLLNDVNVVKTDISTKPSSFSADLADILNATKEAGSLYIKYDLGISGQNGGDVTITHDLLNSDSSASIGVIAVVVLPLKFQVSENGINLNLMDLMNSDSKDDSATKTDKEKDIFGRDEKTSTDDYDKYIDAIKEVFVDYKVTKNVFYAKNETTTKDPIQLTVDFKGTGISQSYGLQSGRLSFSNNEIDKLLNTYPLEVDAAISILPSTAFSITRQYAIGIKIDLGLATDGTIPLFGGEK